MILNAVLIPPWIAKVGTYKLRHEHSLYQMGLYGSTQNFIINLSRVVSMLGKIPCSIQHKD